LYDGSWQFQANIAIPSSVEEEIIFPEDQTNISKLNPLNIYGLNLGICTTFKHSFSDKKYVSWTYIKRPT
jgi:hypothetical protein